jgi:uncharacterized phiE125 gp8 family phage protein
VKSIAIDIDAATTLPLDLGLLKSDLRISGDELDAVLQGQYIPDAMAWAEGVMRRTIISRAHRWIISDFPRRDPVITLPRGKVSAVSSIEYSSNGSTVTLIGPTSGSPTGSDYQEDLRGPFGRVMPNRGASWPSVDTDVLSPVVITYTAGWAKADVPADIRRAMTASVFEAMELKGLLESRVSFDVEFRDKLISAWRCA